MAKFLQTYADTLNIACNSIIVSPTSSTASHVMYVTFKRDVDTTTSFMNIRRPKSTFRFHAPWRASVRLCIRSDISSEERISLRTVAAHAFDDMVCGLQCPDHGWAACGDGCEGDDLVVSYNVEFDKQESSFASGDREAAAGYAVVYGDRSCV